MEVQNQYSDAVIVGGGMLGLSLALMMAKKKLVKRIVLCEEKRFHSASERHEQTSFDDRSTAISAGSVQLLKDIGIWSSLSVHAQAIHKVKVSDKSQLGSSEYCDVIEGVDSDHQKALGWVIENRYLGDCLKSAVDREPRIETLAPAKVENIKPKKNGVKIIVSLGPQTEEITLKTSLLILADGAKSSLASSLGITFSSHDYKQNAIIANVVHNKAHDGVAFEHFTEHGPLAFLPLPDLNGVHRSAVVWTHALDQFNRVSAWDDETFCSELQSIFSSRLGEISHVGKRAHFSLNLISANEQVRRNIVLLGNAAHFLHPVAGQGFNLGLRDAAVLVRSLMSGKKSGRELAAFEDLQRYAQSREVDQWLTTTLSHQFVSLFTSSNPSKRFARTSALTALNKLPPLKTLFFQQMMGQGVNKVSLR